VQLKQRIGSIMLSCVLLLSIAILLINVQAQAPQKAQIVFQSDRDGSYQVYVMDTDGDNLRRLTNNSGSDLGPKWSPDGQNIVFTHSELKGANWRESCDIYVMDANGDNLRRLTNNPGTDEIPAWSPDGQRIAFSSMRDGNNEIYVMDADGNNQRNLTNNPAIEWEPDWSPDVLYRSGWER